MPKGTPQVKKRRKGDSGRVTLVHCYYSVYVFTIDEQRAVCGANTVVSREPIIMRRNQSTTIAPHNIGFSRLAAGDGMQAATGGDIPSRTQLVATCAGSVWIACEIVRLQYDVKQG